MKHARSHAKALADLDDLTGIADRESITRFDGQLSADSRCRRYKPLLVVRGEVLKPSRGQIPLAGTALERLREYADHIAIRILSQPILRDKSDDVSLSWQSGRHWQTIDPVRTAPKPLADGPHESRPQPARARHELCTRAPNEAYRSASIPA